MQTKTIALLLGLLLLSLPAQAQNPCADVDPAGFAQGLAQSDSGLSGTGRSSGDDSGLGGTGYRGGDESGIGGTGIVGTITAFGSICVNGLRVHYDDETPITVDGRAATSASLEIGQVVAIDASLRAGQLEAIKVSIQSAVTGPVTGLDNADHRFSVMGQRIIVPHNFDFSFGREGEALELGSRVSVSGLRRADGVVMATWIARVGGERRDSVAGIAHWVEPDALEVGGIRISLDAVASPSQPKHPTIVDGQFVQALGDFRAKGPALLAAELSTTPLLSPSAERISVEGYVHRLAGDERLWLPGIELDRSSLERVRAKSVRDQRLRVTGRRDARGRLRVERIYTVERPSHRSHFDRTKPRRPDKPIQPKRPTDRQLRPVRPTFDRPPKIDRPKKLDRPTTIDRVIRAAPPPVN